MKKIKQLSLYVTLFFSFSLFVACGDSVKGSDGKSYSDYKDACANNEFGAARQLLEKAGGPRDSHEYFYIFDKESVFLAGMNDEQSTQRLLFLIKEELSATEGEGLYHVNNLIPQFGKLLSLGASVDNIELVRGIYKLYPHIEPGDDVIEYMAKQNTDEDNQLVIMHDKKQYDVKYYYAKKKSLDEVKKPSDEVMNHIDIALMANNKELAKGLMEILNSEDKAKAIAAKKLKKAK